MYRRMIDVEKSYDDDRCKKHEAKLAAIRAENEEEDEEGEESYSSNEEIFPNECEKELPFQNILAEQRRTYSLKQEYCYLIYNELIKDFVQKWDGTYLRKTVIRQNSPERTPKIEEDDKVENYGTEKTDESSIDKQNSTNVDWKLYEPDEQAEIIFINENLYKGRISRRKMEGDGVYRWRNGSQYMGNFENNKIEGKGVLEWQDGSWYEGDFQDGYRHGAGTMVDKNYDLLYIGQWHQGHKHGKGYCRFGKSDSYDGDWMMDKREGVGNYVYPSGSRYVGDWKDGLRHGTGTMTWPNGDVYRGEWKNGQMHGYGEYIWNAYMNKTLSWPQEICYMGEWEEGTRHGKGQMTLSSVGGARYSGEWSKNKKHGAGTIIGNNGAITEGDPLFENDILVPIASMDNPLWMNNKKAEISDRKPKEALPKEIPEVLVTSIIQPEQSISLDYHLDRLRGDRTIESSSSIVSLMAEKCRVCENKKCRCLRQSYAPLSDDKKKIAPGFSSKVSKSKMTSTSGKSRNIFQPEIRDVPSKVKEYKDSEFSSNLEREEYWTHNCIVMHMPRIRKVFDVYAKIFCHVSPNCRLSMSRLSLWQLWRDCGIHERALSLVQIDNYLAADRSTLMERSPCPFGRIEIWQLIHALLELSWQLYTKNGETTESGYPGKLANGLDKFLVNDIYPNTGKATGMLCGPERDLLPLYSVYELYLSVGNTHSARQLMAAIFSTRGTRDEKVSSESLITDTSRPEVFVNGKNFFGVGEKLSYSLKLEKNLILAKNQPGKDKRDEPSTNSLIALQELGTTGLLDVMSSVCPLIKDRETGAIVDMDYELTFLEFFEIFVRSGKELMRERNKRKEASLKKNESEGKTSMLGATKDDERRRSSIRLSTTSKSIKARKKMTSKR